MKVLSIEIWYFESNIVNGKSKRRFRDIVKLHYLLTTVAMAYESNGFLTPIAPRCFNMIYNKYLSKHPSQTNFFKTPLAASRPIARISY